MKFVVQFVTACRLPLWSMQPPILWIPGFLFPEGKVVGS